MVCYKNGREFKYDCSYVNKNQTLWFLHKRSRIQIQIAIILMNRKLSNLLQKGLRMNSSSDCHFVNESKFCDLLQKRSRTQTQIAIMKIKGSLSFITKQSKIQIQIFIVLIKCMFVVCCQNDREFKYRLS